MPGRRILALLAFAPAVACGALVARYAVNVPVWDDFERGKLLPAWAEGTLDLAYLYSPHIDHRIVVPRLVALANAGLTGNDLVLEMGLGFAVVLATALALHGLLRRGFGDRPLLYGLTFGVNLLLFTPLQWENFLWAAQPGFLMPFGCMAGALLVLGSGARVTAKYAACLGLALVASHTFSHGLALWPGVFAAVLLQHGFGSRATRVRFLAAWTLAAVVVLVPYFSVGGLRNTSEPSHAFGLATVARAPELSPSAALHNPIGEARFYATAVGSPFARLPLFTPHAAAPVAGTLVSALFGLGVLGWIAGRRDRESWDRGLPWAALGGYAVAACVLAAVGRAPVTKASYALIPHYISISLYVALGALVLVALWLDRRRPRFGPAPALLAGFGAGMVGLGWLVGLHGMQEWESARLQARTSLLYLDRIDPSYFRRLDGSLDVARRMARALDRHGYLDPPLQRDGDVSLFDVADGAIDGARVEDARAKSERVYVHGFAWLEYAGRRADGVLVAVRDGDGRRILAVAEVHGFPLFEASEFDHVFNEVELPNATSMAPFVARLPLADLPEAPRVDLELLAVDARRMQLHPLRERVRVERGPDGVRAQVVP